MAVLSRSQLKTLWVNGFIPDQDDYVDLFDTMLVDGEAGGGATPPEVIDFSNSLVIRAANSEPYTYTIASAIAIKISDDIMFLNIQVSSLDGTGTGILTFSGLPFVLAQNVTSLSGYVYGVTGNVDYDKLIPAAINNGGIGYISFRNLTNASVFANATATGNGVVSITGMVQTTPLT